MRYSLDFRRRVFEIKERDNLTFEETSKCFGISMRTLFRWQQRIEPKTKHNKRPHKIDEERLRQHVAEYPDAYHYERARLFDVTESAIRAAFKRMGITRKKNSSSSESR